MCVNFILGYHVTLGINQRIAEEFLKHSHQESIDAECHRFDTSSDNITKFGCDSK